ncbi:MAG: YdeI/OmpD-associated family protein [Saprospirales bacterium]|nr:YdeI/OmpD-associated family protein [Saprospirales bacterium]
MNPAVDAYISGSADFAQPILKHLRGLIHQACPDVEETIKWSFPNFVYEGSILCHMAAFKQHCTFGFWKAVLLNDPHSILTSTGETAMGHLGKITCMEDLPPDEVLLDLLKQAAQLNRDKVPLPPKPKSEQKELEVPEYFLLALADNPKAKAVFSTMSYSHKKEYLEWIMEAKTEATRQKRIQTALEWMVEGKGRNWKYDKK